MYVATIGYFDGVHLGHKCLIQQVLQLAHQQQKLSMVVTMDRHPKSITSPHDVPKLLTTNAERQQLLHAAGIDRIEFLHFDHQMMQKSASEFMHTELKSLGIDTLVMGYDHQFGHGGGTPQDYIRWGKEAGIQIVQAHELPDFHASSSQCRKLIQQGLIPEATQLLGHPYSITGPVVPGQQIGRQIGFPTANIQIPTDKLVPPNGVYEIRAGRYKGLANIGTRPTLGDHNPITLEVHLIDYQGDLYGMLLTVEFVRRIRSERKFATLDLLKAQINYDKQQIH